MDLACSIMQIVLTVILHVSYYILGFDTKRHSRIMHHCVFEGVYPFFIWLATKK
jgi:hypothetical protein